MTHYPLAFTDAGTSGVDGAGIPHGCPTGDLSDAATNPGAAESPDEGWRGRDIGHREAGEQRPVPEDSHLAVYLAAATPVLVKAQPLSKI